MCVLSILRSLTVCATGPSLCLYGKNRTEMLIRLLFNVQFSVKREQTVSTSHLTLVIVQHSSVLVGVVFRESIVTQNVSDDKNFEVCGIGLINR